MKKWTFLALLCALFSASCSLVIAAPLPSGVAGWQIAGSSAALTDTGHIKGTVTDSVTGAPISGVIVWAGDGILPWGAATTGPSGDYDIVGLPAMSFTIYFQADAAHLGRYWQQAYSADMAQLVVLGPGETVTGIDARLDKPARIKGSVVDSATGEPVQGIPVYADSTQTGISAGAGVLTDEKGVFEIGGLVPGSYTVRTETTADYLRADWTSPIALEASATVTGIDLKVQPAAKIKGKIVAADTGLSVKGVSVSASPAGDWMGQDNLASTDASGNYVIGGLAAGDYKVVFSGTSDYLGQWWDHATDFASATTVTVGSGEIVDRIGGALEKAAHIKGSVVDSTTGDPIANVNVQASDTASSGYGHATTDYLGRYDIGGLTPGDYAVEFDGRQLGYLGMWWGGVAGGIDSAAVPVGSGDVVDGIDVKLTMGGSISGRVVSPKPFDTAEVRAYQVHPDHSITMVNSTYWSKSLTESGEATTILSYSVRALSGGTYRVEVIADGVIRWYQSGGATFSGARNVQVAEPIDTPSIDVTVTGGVALKGRVLDSAGMPAANSQATLYTYDADLAAWNGNAWTGERYAVVGTDGAYSFDGLLPGKYRVMFGSQDVGYTSEYFDNVPTLDMARDVVVGTSDVTGIDAVLGASADYRAPVTTSNAPGGWVRSASVTFTVDPAQPAVTHWSIDGAPYSAYSAPVSLATEGVHTLSFWSENWSDEFADPLREETTKTAVIRIDRTPPITIASDVPTGWAKGDVTINISATDSLSGIARTYYAINDGASAVATSAITVTAAGVTKVSCWSVDMAGNTEEVKSLTVRIDRTVPVTTSDAKASYLASAIVTLKAEDSGSGVARTSWFLDGGKIEDGTSVVTTATGQHTLAFWSVDIAGNREATNTVQFTVNAPTPVDAPAPGNPQVVSYSGTDRYDTAVQASRSTYATGSVGTVVIATGANWPDALGGAGLAGAHEGPILLVQPGSVPDAVRAEIGRLGAKDAIIVGGTAAVSSAVQDKLATELGGADHVTRIAGGDRFETAAKVAAATTKALSAAGRMWDGSCFIATGGNFPDALAASPLAAALGRPIILTRTAALPAASTRALSDLGVRAATILGGTGAVSPAVEKTLAKQLGASAVDRLAGKDRYTTAITIASYGVAHGLKWNGVAIATGVNFPDALAGGVAQGKLGSVVMLTPKSALYPGVRDVLAAHKAEILQLHYLGGSGALPQSIRNEVLAALQ